MSVNFIEFKSKGPLLFFLHGFPNNHEVFNNIVEELKDRYHLLLIDLPGICEETFPTVDSYSFEKLGQNIVNKIKELTYNNKEYYFIGHDLGCFIIEDIIRRSDLKPQRVFHISGMGTQMFSTRIISPSQWIKSLYIPITFIPGVKRIAKSNLGIKVIDQVMKYSGLSKEQRLIEQKNFYALPLYKHLTSLTIKDIFQKRLKIKTPTTFIFGENEKFLNLPTKSEMKSNYEEASLIKISQAEHWLPLYRNREVLNILEQSIGGTL